MKNKLRKIIKFLLYQLSLFPLLINLSMAQNGVFFKDSQNDEFYNSGLAFFTSPSTLNQSNKDKIPVSTINKNEGDNSLEITWKSAPEGDWSALIIAPGFIFQDITQKDTLFFFAYSPSKITADDLPYIFMEGDPGTTKTNKYDLARFAPTGLPKETWVSIKIPLKTFFNDTTQTNINFAKTKAIIFGQKNADSVQHTMYIDFVAALAGSLSSAPPIPTGLQAEGYERHTELRWNKLPNLEFIDIYRSSDSGNNFDKIGEAQDSIYIDFTGETGRNTNFIYKLQARNPTGTVSGFSTEISTSTFDMTDDQLMTMVQEYTFRYFWEFSHPVSGLAYERNTSVSSETVTSGGSGFGIMSIPVAIERRFITRQQGIDQILKIIGFLENSDRFHGAWPHWMNGSTGKVIPFSKKDNGGDLVETAFLIQGLLTTKEYFDRNNTQEIEIRTKIQALWEGVEWDWYRKNPENDFIYWHWSPNYDWQMNFPLHGWNEVMITYVLGVSSPTNSIPASLYHTGWARNGRIKNGGIKYNIKLPLGHGNGGPLFFTHYSFLGLDPNKFGDPYINTYFEQGRAQSLINRAYCIDNPGNYRGYSENCWGLTASDNPEGYLAHEPDLTRDNGTITPTAALSSMPYTPEESTAALKHFYRDRGEKLWSPMGFYDAFNDSRSWTASSYLAIDQGPIIVMIENYRTQLLWNNFMKNEDIKRGLEEINSKVTAIDPYFFDEKVKTYPNPTQGSEITIKTPVNSSISSIYTINGKKLDFKILKTSNKDGSLETLLNIEKMPSGVYLINISMSDQVITKKIIIE